MPFVSDAQRAWMYANKPEMAKEWEAHTPKGAKLPKHVKKHGHKKEAELNEGFAKIAEVHFKALIPGRSSRAPEYKSQD